MDGYSVLLSALAAAIGTIAAIVRQEYAKRSKLETDLNAAWERIRELEKRGQP